MSQLITEHDRIIASKVVLKLKSGNIEFQYPPKILSDNRRGSWKEGELRGQEPIAVFKTSGPREISLSWTYIVETLNDNFGASWNITKIRTNVNMIRGYFAQIKNAGGSRDSLVVEFTHPILGGIGMKTCRIKAVDVKHSDNIVGSSALNIGAGLTGRGFFNDKYYPLRTDITVDLRLWTKGVKSDDDIVDVEDKEVVNMPKLSVHPTQEELWY